MSVQRRHHLAPPSDRGDTHERERDQAPEHEDTLKEIRVRHSLEATDRRIEEHDAEADPDPLRVARAEEGVERLTRRRELSRRIRHHHAQDDQRRHPSEHVARVAEALGQVVRHGDRIVAVRVLLEWARHPDPRAGDTEHLAHDDPEGVNPNRVAHAGQAEQQPGALSRRVRTECNHPGRQLLTRDVVALEVAGLLPPPQTDRQEHHEVPDDNGHDGS